MSNNNSDGVAVLCELSGETCALIEAYISDSQIPSGIRGSDLHVTLIYDTITDFDSVSIEAKRYRPQMKGEPDRFELVDGGTTLILVFDCPRLDRRHRELKSRYGLSHLFEDFKMHVSLSYNIGEKFDAAALALFSHPILLRGERIVRVETKLVELPRVHLLREKGGGKRGKVVGRKGHTPCKNNRM